VRLFALDPYRDLGRRLAERVGRGDGQSYRLRRFANGELQAILECDVEGEECYLVGTVEPPEENLVEFLLFCHTLQRNGAAAVWAILPYLAYSRQDKAEPRRSRAARWICDVLQASGASGVYSLDLHNREIAAEVGIPIVSISAAPVLAIALRGAVTADWTLVAPDHGAIVRCDRLQSELDLNLRRAHFDKARSESGVVSRLVGTVSDRVLVYDDILDTGETLVQSCRGLREAGAREITVAVTHGLFTGSAWKELWNLGVTRIVVTDSVQPVRSEDPRVEVVSCLDTLVEECGLASEEGDVGLATL